MPSVVDLQRRFWAAFLNSEVKNDGQVPGFRACWDKDDRHQREMAQRRENQAVSGADEDSVAQAVAALHDDLRHYVEPRSYMPSVEEVRQIVALITSRLSMPSPAPSQEAPAAVIEQSTADELWFSQTPKAARLTAFVGGSESEDM